MQETLYERLGGIFAIAAIVNHFSDALIENPIVGKHSANKALADWHNNSLANLPGLKWMRTLWVASISGGPYTYVGTHPDSSPLGLQNAHARFKITSEEFDAVADELLKTLKLGKIPDKEIQEVMGAFAAHKNEVIAGSKI